MTQEIDHLIDYFASTGVSGVVTGLNGPGHAKTSFHYAPGTPSNRVNPLDLYGGHEGQAVDLGLLVGDNDDPRYMDMFRAFGPVESQLAELIHANAYYFVHNGKRVPIAQLDPAIRAIHHNHVTSTQQFNLACC